MTAATARRPACPAHPKASARGTCRGCGLFLCEACGGADPEPRCARCKGAGHPIPWEDPTLPRGRAFVATLQAMIDPNTFFGLLPWTGGLARPLQFALAATLVGAAVATLWSLLGSVVLVKLMEGGLRQSLTAARASPAELQQVESVIAVLPGILLRANLVMFLLTPLTALVQLLVISALTHPLARWSGGRGSFEATFRVVAYSCGAQVLHAVPQVGPLVAVVLRLVFATIGFRRAQGVSTARGFLLASWWIPVQIALGLVLFALSLVILFAPLFSAR